MRKFLFIGICSFIVFWAKAAHIKGGWIYYQYLGKGLTDTTLLRYKVEFEIYRDCTVPSSPAQEEDPLSLTIFNSADGSIFLNTSASKISRTTLDKTTYSPCISSHPPVCYVVLNYETTIELPPSASGYILSYQRCCRVTGITNLSPPSESIGNTYTINIPGNQFGANFPKNSSPVFNFNDTVLICHSTPFQLDYGATDSDGDSLAYSFTPGITGGGATGGGSCLTCPTPSPSAPPPFAAISYSSPYSALDPFATNIQINAHTGLITGLSPIAVGEYVVAVLVNEYRSGILIATTRKELHVKVADCTLSGADLGPDQTTCNGFTFNFQNQSLSANINSYNWSFGDGNFSTLPTPVHTYADTGVYLVKLKVTSTGGCQDSSTKHLGVYPGFFPGFTTTGICKDLPIQFKDTTKTNYGFVNSWSWDFGDLTTQADTSHIKNPTYLYPAANTYNAQLIVTNSKGCVDTAHVPVTVLDKPTLGLPFHDTLICSIDTLQLFANGIGSFSWSPNIRIVNPLVQNPLVFPNVTTTYTVTLNNQGCVNKDSIKVNVLNFITVDAGPDTTICRTDGVTLQPISQALSFKWTPTNFLNNPNIKNPISTPTVASIKYYVTANLGKCQAKDSITIKTVPYPQAAAGTDSTICNGKSVTLIGSAVGNNYLWTPSSLVQNPTSLTTTAFPTVTTVFTLTVHDTLGCPKPTTATVKIIVLPPVQVFAGNDTTIVIGQPLVFNASASSFANQLLWTPATGLSANNILQPTLTVTSAILGNFSSLTYTLQASSPQGCTASDDIIVHIFKTPPTIFVPSAFTPNGDGNNDIIKPILAGMKQLDYFRVYNRYGQLVYETQQQNVGWDGRIKGELQGTAAYVYAAQAVDFNGLTVKQNGTFVLIR